MPPTNPQRPQQRPQFFDVMRPGRTPASPNSRPVLASNHPPVPDNSMKMGAPAVPPGVMNTPQSVAPPQQTSIPAQPQPAARPQPIPASTASSTVLLAAPVVSQEVGQAAVDSQLPAPDSISSPGQAPHTPAKAKHSIWSELLAVLAIAFLIAIIINILLDADIIDLPLPHTNFFEY